MKAVLLLMAVTILASVATVAQGQFVFNNRVPPEIDAIFQLATDNPGFSSLSGNDYTVLILGGPAGASVAQLIPLATTDFRTGAAAGYVNPIAVTVPGAGNGSDAVVLLTVVQGAVPGGIPVGTFGPYTVTVAEAPDLPRNLPLGTNPLQPGLVPEAPPLVLGVLGLGALVYYGGGRCARLRISTRL